MLTRRIARPLIAGIYVAGGADAFLHPDTKAAKAQAVAPAVAAKLGLPQDTETLVRINAGVQVGAGALLAADKLPRLAAVALLASLVPTTLSGHAFWKESDDQARSMQRTQFLKHASMAGGLLLAARDTEGRPSLGWRARRAAHQGRERLPVEAIARATVRAPWPPSSPSPPPTTRGSGTTRG